MKTKITSLMTAGILGTALASQAAVISTITTSASAPTSGDYFSDAFSTTAGSQYWTSSSSSKKDIGQSFTHTTTGDENWNLNSITFLGYDDIMNDSVDLANLTMKVYSGDTGGTLLSTTTFGTGTINLRNQYLTMSLDATETAAIGELTSGGLYTIAFRSLDSDGVRITRSSTTGAYSGGSGIFNNSTLTTDAVFFVGGTAIPEPSSFALLGGLLALGHVMVRRRR